MWVTSALEQFLHRYGETLCCKRGEQNSWTVHGILTTVKDNADAPERAAGARGITRRGRFQYLGEPGPAPGDFICRGKKVYRVLRCEEMRLAGKRLYVRALMKRTEGIDDNV